MVFDKEEQLARLNKVRTVLIRRERCKLFGKDFKRLLGRGEKKEGKGVKEIKVK